MRESRPMSRRGLFLTFEGIEGSGKTTQLRRLARTLRRLGLPILVTRQPGGTAVGRRLRRLLLAPGAPIDARTELLLMFADRRQHLTETIEPALAAGVHVLCDRYTDASRAYQGAGRRLGVATVDLLDDTFCKRAPDRTYLFDCPVPTALARIGRRREGPDRIESERAAFHRRVRRAYLDRAAAEPERILVVDAARPEREIAEGVLADARRLLTRR